jgi:hypothetical protein
MGVAVGRRGSLGWASTHSRIVRRSGRDDLASLDQNTLLFRSSPIDPGAFTTTLMW